jgi:hypothetical protein
MTRLLDLIDRLRRPPALVAWGGRPGIDRQLGSAHDRRELERELHLARIRRAQAERIAAMSRSMNRAMRSLGVAFTVQAEGIVRAMRSLERAGLTVERIHRETRRREALTRAARATDPIANARAALELRRRGGPR